MLESLGITLSINMFFYIMVSFGFVIGIVLMVSPEAFESLNWAMQKEYGLKIRLVPKIENTTMDFIDKTIVRNRVTAGLVITVMAFVLLIVYK